MAAVFSIKTSKMIVVYHPDLIQRMSPNAIGMALAGAQVETFTDDPGLPSGKVRAVAALGKASYSIDLPSEMAFPVVVSAALEGLLFAIIRSLSEMLPAQH